MTALVERDGPRHSPAGAGARGPFLTARAREAAAGWLMSAPAIVLLLVFLVAPIGMAAWVSLSDWNGIGSPFAGGVHAVGGRNYAALLTQPGLPQQQLGESLRNNVYYVIIVVPVQTALALGLALFVSRRRLAGRGFFRTAYYFPSITSSVAVSILFLYIFGTDGVLNAVIGHLGGPQPNWFDDPNGVLHNILSGLGVTTAPGPLASHGFLGVSWWDWLAGPSVAMVALITLAIWTTSGTFMLIFLPAIYAIPTDLTEAAVMDGATGWQVFRKITLPMLRPALFLVLTLGLIGTWQVFDQIFLISQGNPAGTTLTPAYLSYLTSFGNQQWGQGAAIAFILFAIIVVLTIVQRLIIAERPARPGGVGQWLVGQGVVRRRRLARRALLYLALAVFAVIYIYPFLLDIGTSFKTETDAVAHPLNPFPDRWVVTAFVQLGQQDFARWLANSVLVAVFVTIGRLLFDSMAGYALARLRFRGRSGLLAAVIAVMAVPGVVLLIPTFLVLKELQLFNSYPGMILPLVTDAAGVFIMRQFFLTVPPAIEEAAKIDGAGIFRTYWSVVLPMARPALLTLMILSFQGSWNNFSLILVAHSSPSLDTLTTGVGRLVSGQLGAGSQYPLQLAAALAMTVPVAVIFFVFQKYIMRTGEGAIKE